MPVALWVGVMAQNWYFHHCRWMRTAAADWWRFLGLRWRSWLRWSQTM